MSARPNFLFIITDQHRADHLGCYGDRVVRTPHIDALAARGVRAERCYVASPICMPNRASIVTGRMPSAHGVRHNGIDLDLASTTFVELLRQAGYATALLGKSHLQCINAVPAQVPPNPKDRLPHEARQRGPGRYAQELESTWEQDLSHDLDLPYYGFERAQISIMHGDQQAGHWRRWLRRQVNDADHLVGPQNAEPTPDFELTRSRQAWRTRVPEELYPTFWIAENTKAEMRRAVAEGRPFFIQCSFPDPHHPFTPPGRYWDLYRPEDMALPASFHAPHRNPPPTLHWLQARRSDGTAVKHSQALFAATEREVCEALALNYGSIVMIDDAVGRVLAELEQLGVADNTVVIFTSDHGDYLGAHQLLLKGPVHYEPLIRVPFIWADPAGPQGAVNDDLLQSTDIAPTVLARAGVPAFNGIQGRTLGAPARDAVLIEEEGQRVYLGFDRRVRMRTLVTRRHRLSVYDGAAWGELYDRQEDPDEVVNLWDDAGARAVRAELMQRMVQEMIAASETSPYPAYMA